MPNSNHLKPYWVAVLLLTAIPFAAQSQTDCEGLDTWRDRVQAHWRLASDQKAPDSTRLFHYQKTLSFSLQCPEQCSDTAILATIEIIQLQFNLDSLDRWMQRAESYVETCRPYLSPALYFRTVDGVRFEKYRHWTTLGYYDQAIDGFLALLAGLPVSHPDSLKLYENRYACRLYLGWLHYKKGDYPQALEWYTLAAPYLPEWDFEYSTAHFEHMGMILMALHKDDQAKPHLFESERRFYSAPDTLRPSAEYLLYTYLDLVEIFNRQQKPDSAFIFLEKARQLRISNPWTYVQLKRYEGATYLNIADFDRAISAYATGLEMADSLYAGKQYRKGELLLDMGEAYLTKKTPLSALRSVQKSLAHFEPSFNSGDFSQNPAVENSPLKYEMLRAFHLKGKALLAQSTPALPDTVWLKLALNTFGRAIDLIQILRNDYDYDLSKEMLNETSLQIFEGAIETAYALFQENGKTDCLQKAFTFAEKSKALSLLESLTDIGAKQFAGLPDSLLRQETDLKLQIAFYERSAARSNSEASQQTNQLAAYERRQQLEQLRKKMEVENPAYFNTKYRLPHSEIERLKKQLADNETFVEYFWGDRKMYFFTVTNDTARWGAFPVDASLRNQVEEFKNLASSRKALLRPSNLRKFARLGYDLYQKLISPLDLQTPKVLLAADAWLNLLPFDALLTDSLPQEDYSKFPFLIRQRQMTRVFSAAVLTQELNKMTANAPNSLLVIAPDEQLQGRPDSLAVQFGGNFLLNGNAGKQQVFEQAGQYKNLLFYAHAEADTIEPFIHLHREEKLYLKDLYARPVSANLVILAACEAGTGEVKRGEGVMSLARGFAYGGTSNVGLTLWEVQSSTTLRLAGDFLSGYFEKNKSPADAMHEAKLKLLAQPPQGDASPYLWAGFVLVGR